MIEESGSVYLTNGSGSGRPKNMDPTDPDSDPDQQHCRKQKDQDLPNIT
jgi:hypothetical protein